jgi:3-hydroxybutyryl-CoA dehydrogenase
MSLDRVAVVGVGTMGSRIGFQCAVSGKQVNLYDASPQALQEGLSKIQTWLRERTSPDEVAAVLERIRTCGSLEDCVGDVDLVVENVPENLPLKRDVFAKMDRAAAPSTIFLTNSSSLPASRLASATGRPDKVLNANFHDPVHQKDLVEVMRDSPVSDETLNQVECFLKEIKTIPVVTDREIMGFSFNRIWRTIKRECLHLVADGYSNFEDIDRCWILTFGGELAPFLLMDRVGLDVVRDIEMQYYHDSGEERDRPPELLDRMIANGRRGVKSGRGFYTYPNPEYQQPGWLRKEPPWTPDKMVKLED